MLRPVHVPGPASFRVLKDSVMFDHACVTGSVIDARVSVLKDSGSVIDARVSVLKDSVSIQYAYASGGVIDARVSVLKEVAIRGVLRDNRGCLVLWRSCLFVQFEAIKSFFRVWNLEFRSFFCLLIFF